MESLECLVKYWKMFETVRVTADGVVCRYPCFLASVHIEPTDGDAVIDLHVYDGHDTSGEEKLTFTQKGGSVGLSFDVPLYFKRGLYLHRETNVTSVTVQFMAEPD